MIRTLELYDNQYMNFGAPVCVFFDITYRCNLKCFYCFSNDNNLKKMAKNGLTVSEIKNILKDLSVSGTKVVEFSGGEPLMQKDFLEILRYSKALGLEISFVSNGTLFSKEICEELVTLVTNVNITLRGCDEFSHDKATGVEGSYVKTINSIKLLNSYGIKVGILYDPTYLNYENIYDYFTYLIEIEGVKLNSIFLNRINIRNIDNHGTEKKSYCLQTIEEYEIAFGQLDRIFTEYGIFIEIEAFPLCKVNEKYHRFLTRCNYGISNASIDFEGNLKMCPVSSKILGNLRNESVKTIWSESPIIKKFRTLEWMNAKCKSCLDFEICGGGCYTSKPETMSYQDDYFIKEKVYSEEKIPCISPQVIIKDMDSKAYIFFKRIVPRLLPAKKYIHERDIFEISGSEYKVMRHIDSLTAINEIKEKLSEIDSTQFDNIIIALVNRGVIFVK